MRPFRPHWQIVGASRSSARSYPSGGEGILELAFYLRPPIDPFEVEAVESGCVIADAGRQAAQQMVLFNGVRSVKRLSERLRSRGSHLLMANRAEIR